MSNHLDFQSFSLVRYCVSTRYPNAVCGIRILVRIELYIFGEFETMVFIRIAVLLLIVSPVYAYAESYYVSGVASVTLREGPGTEHKIIQMINSGDKLSIIGDDVNAHWLNVRTENGSEGWVLTRFVTSHTPTILLYREAEEKIIKLEAEIKNLKGIIFDNESVKDQICKERERSLRNEIDAALLQVVRLKNDNNALKKKDKKQTPLSEIQSINLEKLTIREILINFTVPQFVATGSLILGILCMVVVASFKIGRTYETKWRAPKN